MSCRSVALGGNPEDYQAVHDWFDVSKAFPDEWRTLNTQSIARQIFAARDFALMPILGDALEDAGRTDYELFDHLRNDRGLWGLSDWVLNNLVCRAES